MIDKIWLILSLSRFMIFWEDDMSIKIGNVLVHYFDICLVLLTFLLLLLRPGKINNIFSWIIALILVFAFLQAFINGFSPRFFFSWTYWIMPMLGTLLIDWKNNDKFLIEFTGLIIIWNTMQILFFLSSFGKSIANQILNITLPTYWGFLTRPITTMGYATSASYSFIVLLIIRAALSHKRSVFDLTSLTDVAGITSILLTLSRGAYLTLFALFVSHLICIKYFNIKKFLVLLLVFMLVLITIPAILLRIGSEQAFDISRFNQLAYSLRLFAESDNYLLGTSFGTFLPRFWTSITNFQNLLYEYAVRATHNSYVVILNECGLLGLLLFATSIVFVYAKLKYENLDTQLFTQALLSVLIWMIFETSPLLPEYSYSIFICIYLTSSAQPILKKQNAAI